MMYVMFKMNKIYKMYVIPSVNAVMNRHWVNGCVVYCERLLVMLPFNTYPIHVGSCEEGVLAHEEPSAWPAGEMVVVTISLGNVVQTSADSKVYVDPEFICQTRQFPRPL